MLITEILIGIISILILLTYILFKRQFKYWDKKNVPIIPNPVVPYGSVAEMIKQKTSMHDYSISFYNYFKNTKQSKFGGMYFFGTPAFIPVDIELIRSVFIQDFSHFVNRGLFHNENDPLTMFPFNMEDDEWRDLRAATSHAYTTGKVKMMFDIMMEKSKSLEKVMQKCAETNEAIDVKDYTARYTTDVIASVAFGLDVNTFDDTENNEFLKMSHRIFIHNGYEALKTLAYYVAPLHWLRAIRFKITKPDVEKYFMDIVKHTVEYREKNGIERKDYLQMLIELKNTGLIKLGDSEKVESMQTKHKISLNGVAALAYEFFIGGFDTSATTATFALMELGINQDIQDRARDEIREISRKYNGNLTYEAFGDMHYIEMIIKETLRKYPVLAFLPRVCTKEYNVPGTDVVIEKGTKIMIPVTGVHYDPEFYDNPDEFRPERFEPTKKIIQNNYYFSFGEGPRMCVGMRVGMIQAKVALVAILKNHKVFLDKKKTIFPIQIEPKFEVTTVRGGVWMNATRVE